MKTIIVIPARYASSRFPGKPLVKIMGTESILLTYRAAARVAGADAVYVATDSDEIRKATATPSSPRRRGWSARRMTTWSSISRATRR